MTDKITNFPEKYVAENKMLEDLNDLVAKYNGEMSNVAMIGVLNAATAYVTLSVITNTED